MLLAIVPAAPPTTEEQRKPTSVADSVSANESITVVRRGSTASCFASVVGRSVGRSVIHRSCPRFAFATPTFLPAVHVTARRRLGNKSSQRTDMAAPSHAPAEIVHRMQRKFPHPENSSNRFKLNRVAVLG